MSAKEVLYDVDARERFGLGLDALANAVKVTLGPRGRNVVLDRGFGAPTITKDGVSVAREIELCDPIANMGAQMVKEVASKTSDLAGDGTTTATVLAQAIYAAGTSLIAGGIDPMQLKRGIDAAVVAVVADLARQSTPTQGRSEIAQVGTISANGDATIGALIAEAMEKVGKEGVITLEEANATETTLDVVEGMQLDRGYLSPYFVTDPARMEALLEDAYVLVHENKIARMQSLLPLVEKVVQAEKSLLIIAEDVDGEALATLVVNKLRGTLRVCAVKAPGYGDARKETLNDLAVVTGGKAFMEELGLDLESATLADLGRVKKVIVERERTVLVGGAGDVADVAVRTRQLRARLEETEPGHERTGLETRLGKLAGGVAVIKVGAHSETEMKEKKDRVEDALHATRAAVEEGVVAGGGVALLRSRPALAALRFTDDARYGVDVIRRAIEAPLRQIAANCGVEGAVVVDEVRKGTGAFGFNGATGGYEDLVAAGIIDPTKVVRVALQNAASVASLMLTAQAVVAGRGDATGEGAS